MEHLSSDHEDHLNHHKNSHKQCDEIGYSVVNLQEGQWKLRPQHDQNFPMEGKLLQNKYQRHKKERNPKEQDCKNHSLTGENTDQNGGWYPILGA